MDEYQVSQRQLAYGTFVAKNRKLIRNIVRFGLLAIDVGIFVFVGFMAVQTVQLELSVPSIVDRFRAGEVSFASVQQEKPEAVKIVSTDVFRMGEIFVDVIAKVQNPNKDWAVYQGTYKFTVGGREVTGSTQLLPGETKYIAVPTIDVGIGTSVSDADLTFTDMTWQRIKDPAVIPVEKWNVKSAAYETVTEPSETTTGSGRVAATVENGSIYGFREAEVLAVLELNNEPIGVRVQRVGQWDSFQKKELQFTWPKAFAMNAKPVIQVDTNLLDEQNILTSAE